MTHRLLDHPPPASVAGLGLRLGRGLGLRPERLTQPKVRPCALVFSLSHPRLLPLLLSICYKQTP